MCRFLTEVDHRLIWKFAFNFGVKGGPLGRAFQTPIAQRHSLSALPSISIINSCQLRCQGCWVDVAERRQMIELDALNRLIRNAKKHGNSFFGLLGGEPFMHPQLLEVLARTRIVIFRFLPTASSSPRKLPRSCAVGNATPLISIEGSEIVSDQRRGGKEVLHKTLEGLRNCVDQKLIVGVASSICQTNYNLVSEDWLRRLIDMGVMYAWFHTYRVIGPEPAPSWR